MLAGTKKAPFVFDSECDTVIKNIQTAPSEFWEGREQGPYLGDWGCSSEEIEAKVKELGLESVAQVVSLDACRNTKWPKLNDTGMILFGEHHGVSFLWVGCRSGSQGVRAYRVQRCFRAELVVVEF